MSTPPTTITRRVFNGTQTILSALGLSGLVEGTIGLGDMAVELISSYLMMSGWLMSQASRILPATPPDLLFHYFLLGAPFWTPMLLGLRRILGSLSPNRSTLSFVWEILTTPTAMVIAEFYASHQRVKDDAARHGKDKASSSLWPLSKPIQPEVLEKWRETRKTHFWTWLKISTVINLLRIALICFILFVFTFLTIFPLLMVLIWPLVLIEAVGAKLLDYSKGAPREVDADEAGNPSDPYVTILSRSLDRFTLVLVVFVIFISVSAGVERNGGAEAIFDRFIDKLNEATQ